MNPPSQQPPKRRRTISLITGTAAAIVTVAVAASLLGRQSTHTGEPLPPVPAASLAGSTAPPAPGGSLEVRRTLDKVAAEQAIKRILTESYGVAAVSSVQCPGVQEVMAGNRFECTLVADGASRKVTVTFTDNDGTYEVSRPVPAGR